MGDTGVFGKLEADFFRAGEAGEFGDDADDAAPAPSFWGRVVGRRTRPATEPPFVATGDTADDADEWEWRIALANARSAE